MIYWKTYRPRYQVQAPRAVEVERATEQCVWINGRRNAKISDYDNYFETWEEAQAWLIEHCESAVVHARNQLATANGLLGNAKGLKRPPALAESVKEDAK